MASVLVIPIIVVIIVGLSSYLIYKFWLYDFLCKRKVNQTLKRYDIKETPYQIIREYHASKGETLSPRQIRNIEKNYRQNEPEQFLAMYDSIRDKLKKKDT